MKKIITILSAFLLVFSLASCGESGEEVAETVSRTEETTTEQTQAKTTAETTTKTAKTETTTSLTETSSSEETNGYCSMKLYDATVYEGVPEICDIDEILAKRRDDMYNYGEPYDSNYNNDQGYVNAVTYLEKNFGYSFDTDNTQKAYVKDDFDCDGKDEYYLCMTEGLLHKYIYEEYDENYYHYDVITTVYYIDDDGKSLFTFGKLNQYISGVIGMSDDELDGILNQNLLFEYEFGVVWINKPQIMDYGNCKHLFWKYSGGPEGDYGAEIFWEDKHINSAFSVPSEKLGGVIDFMSVLEYEFNTNNDDLNSTLYKFIFDENNDPLDYPGFEDNMNTMADYLAFNGSEYVYNISVDTSTVNDEITSGAVKWDDHSKSKADSTIKYLPGDYYLNRDIITVTEDMGREVLTDTVYKIGEFPENNITIYGIKTNELITKTTRWDDGEYSYDEGNAEYIIIDDGEIVQMIKYDWYGRFGLESTADLYYCGDDMIFSSVYYLGGTMCYKDRGTMFKKDENGIYKSYTIDEEKLLEDIKSLVKISVNKNNKTALFSAFDNKYTFDYKAMYDDANTYSDIDIKLFDSDCIYLAGDSILYLNWENDSICCKIPYWITPQDYEMFPITDYTPFAVVTIGFDDGEFNIKDIDFEMEIQ